MRERFGAVVERIGRHLFADVVMQRAVAAKIRAMAKRGGIVYVLRHRSWVDYFLVNWVLRREGLPLPVFANDISSTWLAPFGVRMRRVLDRALALLGRPDRARELADHDYCARAVAEGRPVLVFMRGRPVRGVRGTASRSGTSRVGSDYLRELIHSQREREGETYIVPLALFRGHSMRRTESSGISSLVYTVQDAPSDRGRILTYWWNRRDLFVTAGSEVALGEFCRRYAGDGEERLVRRLARSVQIFLHREERVVLGPALMPRRRVRTEVLENDESVREIERMARETGVSEGELRREAQAYFDEMASDFNGAVLSLVASIFRRLWGRMFQGMEPVGLDRVIDKAKRHPIVLVPCHRSHLDYMILSYLFYQNFVSPPHIAAGINMRFWPMGRILRSCGAYFIRRTFGDNELYKLVFRQYQKFLIREGYTQEFFIEGGRSRTGKILTPKLGMLTVIVDAFLSGIRRDLYLVPVSIHYGRIVEEDAYQQELTGGEKEPESFRGLVRARRFLKQKFGTVYVSFAEPVSLNEALGPAKQRFMESPEDEEVADERRRFVQRLGFRILREVNEVSMAGATSVSATVLLGATHWGLRYEEFRDRANALTDLLLARQVRPTGSLERNRGDFRESVDFLASSSLIEAIRRGHEEVLVVREPKRLALDFYKNNIIHYFLVPSLVTYCILQNDEEGVLRDEHMLVESIGWWLDFFRWEFPLPERAELGDRVQTILDRYRKFGMLESERIVPGHPMMEATVNVLQNFREAYYLAARTLVDELGENGGAEKALLTDMRKSFLTSVTLGEVSKPEGASEVTLRNALSRYQEMGFIRMEMRGRSGKERWWMPGESFEELGALASSLAASLEVGAGAPRKRALVAANPIPGAARDRGAETK